MNIDINDPKVRWAQQQADVRKEKMVIVRNFIGGLDIKPEASVNLFFADTLCVIEPKNHRFADREPSLINSCIARFNKLCGEKK